MAVCENCGCKFDKRRAKKEFKDYFNGELEYDDTFHGRDLCAECAIVEAEGLGAQGRAINMMNGEEEYDPDFVNRWL